MFREDSKFNHLFPHQFGLFSTGVKESNKKIPAIKQSEHQTVNIHHMWRPAFRSKVNAMLLERFWAAQVVRWYKYAQRHH